MPKTLNKHNLAIARLCSSKPGRYQLPFIYVTPECTVETDGRQLMIVTTAETDTFPTWDTFPTMEGIVPSETFESFLLPRDIALKLATELPSAIQAQVRQASKKKKTVTSKPKRSLSIEQRDGESSLTVEDGTGNSTLFKFRKREGIFPDYKLVLPDKEKMKFTITFNSKILLAVLQQFAVFGDDVVIRLNADDRPVRIDAHNFETNQTMTAVVMPLGPPTQKI